MGSEDFIDQILTSLKVISMIKEGQKVRIRNGLLDLETKSTGLGAAMRRWLHNDTSHNALLYIKNVVGHALELIKISSQSYKLESGLTESLTGLSALTVTYGDDMGTVAAIGVLQLRIRSELEVDKLPSSQFILNKNSTHNKNKNERQ